MAEATDERTDVIRSRSHSQNTEAATDSPGIREAPGKQAAIEVADAPDPAKVEPEVQQSALEWLLSDEGEEDAGYESFEIDVAPAGKSASYIKWVLRPLNAEELKVARRAAQSGNRQQRRRVSNDLLDADLTEVNARIVAMATVDPDLMEAARRKNLADPVFVLKHRFRFKPGLIDQLASKVLTISGYEEEAIRDPIEVRAAEN